MEPNNEEYISYRLPVNSEFSEVFSHFYFAENRSSSPLTKILLPSFQTIMVFSFGVNALFNSNQGTSIEINKCIVLGPIKAAFNYTLPPKAEILVVNFKADSFYRFFGKASMSDQLRFNPDDAVAGNCFTALW